MTTQLAFLGCFVPLSESKLYFAVSLTTQLIFMPSYALISKISSFCDSIQITLLSYKLYATEPWFPGDLSDDLRTSQTKQRIL